MDGAIPPLPQYAFMVWCSVRGSTHNKYIWWTVQVMKRPTVSTSPAIRHFYPLRFKYSPQHPVLRHSQFVFWIFCLNLLFTKCHWKKRVPPSISNSSQLFCPFNDMKNAVPFKHSKRSFFNYKSMFSRIAACWMHLYVSPIGWDDENWLWGTSCNHPKSSVLFGHVIKCLKENEDKSNRKEETIDISKYGNLLEYVKYLTSWVCCFKKASVEGKCQFTPHLWTHTPFLTMFVHVTGFFPKCI